MGSRRLYVSLDSKSAMIDCREAEVVFVVVVVLRPRRSSVNEIGFTRKQRRVRNPFLTLVLMIKVSKRLFVGISEPW